MEVALWTVFVLLLLAGLWILGTWPSPVPADGAWWHRSSGAGHEGDAAAKGTRTTEAPGAGGAVQTPVPPRRPEPVRPAGWALTEDEVIRFGIDLDSVDDVV